MEFATHVLLSLLLLKSSPSDSRTLPPSGICYRQMTRIVPVTMYRLITYTEYYRCGIRTCSREVNGTSAQTEDRRISVNVSYCCPGYFNSTNNCVPICRSACSNGTICVAPEVCGCRAGRTGLNCATDINECEDTDTCDHFCSNTNGSFYCSCERGYVLNPDGRTCRDVDECSADSSNYADECVEGSDGCEQICINSVGSYNCGCFDNYTLTSDLHNCLGMPQNLSFNKVNSSEYLLTWGLPIYSRNNVDVIYYSVHCSSPDHAGLVFNLSTEARRAEISGLLPFTVYSCCVSALTNRGTSPPACLLVKTSEEAPSTPPQVLLINTSSSTHQLTVTVSPPATPNGEITVYTFYITLENGTSTVRVLSSHAGQLILQRLSPYELVQLQVTANTSAGESPKSTLMSARTKQDVPTIVTKVRIEMNSHRDISISWGPPLRANGVLLNYTVRVYPSIGVDNDTIVHVSPDQQRSVNISYLVPYIPYEVVVTASTKVGDGEAWMDLVYTLEGVPDISSAALRTEDTSATVTWTSSLDPELLALVLANTTLLHYAPVSTPIPSPCPSPLDMFWSLPPPSYNIEVPTQAGRAMLTGLTASKEYCITVQATTVTGNVTFSHTQRLSLPSNVSIQFQLRLLEQETCQKFTGTHPDSVKEASSALLEAILNVCNCSYTIHHIYLARFFCSNSLEQLVNYQAKLLNAEGILAVDLAPVVEKWLSGQPSITVGGELLQACSEGGCLTVNPTQGIQNKGKDSSIRIPLGGLLGAVIGFTTLVLLVMSTGALVKEFYKSKRKKILNDRDLRITRGENIYVNPRFIPDEKTTYNMFR